ncbi:TetR/AcrR family transcriptional regulator [Kitasatospora brasiliensis]|uniref:TetR/AcrR family transcriptional regulator n=1 Tax=Kitasatospora brasiliensis TaxID=3058040 RepID=UPI00292FE3E4|nr:TetR family transcriptional regulator [Kitasatospora sp. K002]
MAARTPRTTDTPEGSAHPPGLRERKKQQTRDALVQAAHKLFLRQGFARTTVDEIASAVDVSQRTFFRYFANKDEVALAVMAVAEDYFIECLRNRPAEETPLQALRASIVKAWLDLGSAETTSPDSIHSALELMRMLEETPPLLAAHLRRVTEQERLVVQVLAEREGLDPTEDLRPAVLAAVFASLLRSAHMSWSAGQQPPGPEGMVAVIERYFDNLAPALAGHWR